MSDLKYLIAIAKFNKIGAVKLERLRQYFASMRDAWEAPAADLRQAGLEERLVEEFMSARRQINPEQELELLNKEQLTTVTLGEPNYPTRLAEIQSPPIVLFARGNLELLNRTSIAIVGTRGLSSYGRYATEQLARELGQADLVVVSGLALGIDTVAHATAVRNNKPTIAVLGSGLDRANIYPRANFGLAEDIVKTGGLLLSEYPVGMPSLQHHFPMRNRIISGLTLGTLVIEAGESSGALITAKFALDQNREVFAVPGPLTSTTSIGTNKLIQQGAKLVTTASDILEELNLQQIKNFARAEEVIPASPIEAAIMSKLQAQSLHINDLVKQTGLSINEINAALMMLEMKGGVRNIGGVYHLAHN